MGQQGGVCTTGTMFVSRLLAVGPSVSGSLRLPLALARTSHGRELK